MFHSMKPVIFTRLEFSTSQKRARIVSKIGTGNNWNMMPFQIYKILFLRSTMMELNTKLK